MTYSLGTHHDLVKKQGLENRAWYLVLASDLQYTAIFLKMLIDKRKSTIVQNSPFSNELSLISNNLQYKMLFVAV